MVSQPKAVAAVIMAAAEKAQVATTVGEHGADTLATSTAFEGSALGGVDRQQPYEDVDARSRSPRAGAGIMLGDRHSS